MCELIKKIKKFYSEGSLGMRAFTVVIGLFGFSNRNIAGLEIKNKVYSRLKKKYVDKAIVDSLNIIRSTVPKNNIVWICWFQGIDEAPQIVKDCVFSIQKNMKGYKIKIIHYANMFDYVSFPDYVIKKWKKGIIKDALMSDLLRMELLIRYGGIWMDATVFMTGELPLVIANASFFIYSHIDANDATVKYNNWFIKSNKNNEFLITIRDLLYDYWKKENKVHEYFIWHLFATIVKNTNPKLNKEMPVISDLIPEHLYQVLNDEFDEQYWEYLCKLTPIHKLSYKKEYKKNEYYSYYDKVRELNYE